MRKYTNKGVLCENIQIRVFCANHLCDILSREKIQHEFRVKNLVGGEVESHQAGGQVVLKLQLQCEQFPRSHWLLCFKIHLCIVLAMPVSPHFNPVSH